MSQASGGLTQSKLVINSLDPTKSFYINYAHFGMMQKDARNNYIGIKR